ncbi:hypothetical protein [Emticicia sp. SJ17W-69]|uniref:hypothetical protein n=1 Tax=Emticicia sp. SJ17W-69 TaxID=3421657 RepID=UPI003EB95314
MKKAYNETWIENIGNQAIIKNWHEQKMLSDEQFNAAQNAFPVGFHRSNIFVKIGLFLFTNIVGSASFGFLSLFLAGVLSESSIGLGIISLIYAGILFFFLEYFIKKNNFYRSGADNALLYAMLGAVFAFFIAISDFELPAWIYCSIALIILLPALLRYADPLVAISLYLTWIALWFIIVTKFPIGKLIIPFVIMLVSAASYFFIQFWRKQENTPYYTDCQDIIEILALATFYLGGNYLVVREGNAMLNGLSDSIQISFAPLFYLLTAAIPVFYMVRGLQKHNRKLLIVGILAIAFSVFTYRTYFSVLPLELALTIGGGLLVLLIIFTIRALKTQKFGLTYMALGSNKFQNLEAFIVNQAIQQPSQSDKMKFGEGNFGGGGAGSEY